MLILAVSHASRSLPVAEHGEGTEGHLSLKIISFYLISPSILLPGQSQHFIYKKNLQI